MSIKQAFTQILKDKGIPTTLEEHQAIWDQLLVDKGYAVKNTSPQSPFWRAQRALIGDPALQLTNMLTEHIMPNTFVLHAEDSWLDLHGDARNTERLPAVKAQGNLTISRIDGSGELVVPAGTLIKSDPINGIVYQLKTLYDTTFADGVAEMSALAEALIEGSDHNLVAGYYNKFVTPIEGVNVLNLDDWLVTAGQDIESNENYRLRIRDKFATLGDFHVDAVYRSIISEFPGILSDNIIFEHTAPRGPGSANAYVFLAIGQVSQAVVDQINNHIASGYHGHGDDLLVFAMPTQPQNITFNMWQHPNTSDISNDAEQFIRAAFRENAAYKATTCKPNNTFSFSLLIAELHAQFPEIKTMNFSNADIVSGVWLPTIATLTVVNNV